MSHRLILLVAGIVALWLFRGGGAEYRHPEGIMIAEAPRQTEVEPNAKRWNVGDFLVTPLARFEMQGRVLGVNSFWFGTESKLSPVDFIMAWGPLSDTAVLRNIRFRQSGRFYRWSARELPVPRDVISQHTANMHMIPADAYVRRKLQEIEREDLVQLSGYLVRVDRPDGWHWVSSLTRNDTGSGACELIWVESIRRIVG